MILADSSVWIDHFRKASAKLISLLERDLIAMHPFIIGEIVLGSVRERAAILSFFRNLPSITMATDHEVIHLIERHHLHGRGIGYIDAHLLAAVRLTGNITLWTQDKRLHAAAQELKIVAVP